MKKIAEIIRKLQSTSRHHGKGRRTAVMCWALCLVLVVAMIAAPIQTVYAQPSVENEETQENSDGANIETQEASDRENADNMEAFNSESEETLRISAAKSEETLRISADESEEMRGISADESEETQEISDDESTETLTKSDDMVSNVSKEEAQETATEQNDISENLSNDTKTNQIDSGDKESKTEPEENLQDQKEGKSESEEKNLEEEKESEKEKSTDQAKPSNKESEDQTTDKEKKELKTDQENKEKDASKEQIGKTKIVRKANILKAPAANAEGDGSSTNEAVDFTDYITSVELKQNGQTIKESNDGKYHLSKNASVSFTLNYKLESGVLGSDKNTITYQIPDGIQLSKAEQGNVYSKNSTDPVGTYEITKDGKITIVFKDEYVKKNSEEYQAIEGHISFSGNIQGNESGESGEQDIKFSDSLSFPIKIEEGETAGEGDLSVQKEATNINVEEGYADYKITVNSQNGTGSTVTILDTMYNGMKLDNSFAITVTKNGEKLGENLYSIDNFGEYFKVKELPRMQAGDVYVITYRGKLTNDLNGTLNVKNGVDVYSTKTDNTSIQTHTDIDTTFTKNMLEKTGEEKDDFIEWRIVVNEAKTDLGGWKLLDELNGEKLENKEVTISPNINGTDKITLPYEFPAGAKETYTITYTTSKDKQLGSNKTINKATLKGPNGENIETGEVGVGSGDAYNPLSKEAMKITSENDGEATIDWKITISAGEQNIEPTEDTGWSNNQKAWIYTDELWNGQWFTKAQLDTINSELRKTGLQYVLQAGKQVNTDDLGDYVSYNDIQEGEKYKAYRVAFLSKLETGNTISYEYQSTAPAGDESKDFRNNANINGKVYTHGDIHYESTTPKPIEVEKKDKRGDGAHDWEALKNDISYNSELVWEVDINHLESYNGENLVVKEYLPEDVELKYLELLADEGLGATSIDINRINGSDYLIDNQYHFSFDWKTTEFEEKYLEITIPKDLVNQDKVKQIRMVIGVNINSDFSWPIAEETTSTATFENTVTVESSGEKLGDASQTQTVTHTINDSERAVKKGVSGIGSDSKLSDNNILTYSVLINPKGEDLIEGSEVLTLVDELSFGRWSGLTVSAVFLQNSVKLIDVETDNVLSSEEYSYQEEDAVVTTDKEMHRVTYKIPDGKALRLEYQYRITSTNGNPEWPTIVNTVSLEGVSHSGTKDSLSNNIGVQSSAATADALGVTLYKVDSQNDGIKLNGATFDLYYYDLESSSYKKQVEGLKTGDEGTVKFGISDQMEFDKMSLVPNTAYYLVETSAPSGYQLDETPIYFYVYSADYGKYSNKLPGGFSGKRIETDGNIKISNTKSTKVVLPETGGIGTKWFTMSGLLFMAAGAAMVMKKSKRSSKGELK